MTPQVFTDEETAVRVIYRNHRGETSVRRIRPLCVRFGVSTWHEGTQWFLECFDLDKEGAARSFAMKDILRWGDEGSNP